MVRTDWNRKSGSLVLEALYHGAIRRGWAPQGARVLLTPERVAVLFGFLDERALVPHHPDPPTAPMSDMNHARDVLRFHRDHPVKGWIVERAPGGPLHLHVAPRAKASTPPARPPAAEAAHDPAPSRDDP